MDNNGWNLFNNNNNSSVVGRGQNGNCTNVAWDIWELGTTTTTTTSSRYDWPNNHNSFATAATAATTSAASLTEASAIHALMFNPTRHNQDPHLMCLKLGKRHYFEDAIPLGDRHVAAAFSISKKGKPYYGPAAAPAPASSVPKCQVEGCQVALVNAKEYHRRHKVCEMHSKAPKVVVFGQEQRFCQQCSRFHAVGEFDESKRSCRRRLAGHNERRRKSSHGHGGGLLSLPRNQPPQAGCALSLLSTKNESWISSPDLSSRCSAALRELIAENRAAILGRNHHNTLMEDLNGYQNHHHNYHHNHFVSNQHQILQDDPHVWDRFNPGADTTMTLNLMQAPNSAFGFLSVRGKSKETEDYPDFWSTLGETHVV